MIAYLFGDTKPVSRGYRVNREVVEIASGLNDQRPKFSKLLSDRQIGLILVEQKDWTARFGFNYLVSLLGVQGRRIEVINESDSKDELVDDFVALITSMAAHIYGKRQSKRRAAQMVENWSLANFRPAKFPPLVPVYQYG